jgi:hypothetical protein
MTDFSSIILRSLDLCNPEGTTTVSEHQRIITSKGYVWWGWWDKRGETVPEAAFRKIVDKIATSKPYKLFLFDAGRCRLHEAHLADIKWDNRLTRIATPDRAATPDYYGNTRYLAWVKLTSIDSAEIPEGELLNWSYIRLNKFLETKKSAFSDFDDKLVSSFTEPRNQYCTIWFIRARRSNYKVH